MTYYLGYRAKQITGLMDSWVQNKPCAWGRRNDVILRNIVLHRSRSRCSNGYSCTLHSITRYHLTSKMPQCFVRGSGHSWDRDFCLQFFSFPTDPLQFKRWSDWCRWVANKFCWIILCCSSVSEGLRQWEVKLTARCPYASLCNSSCGKCIANFEFSALYALWFVWTGCWARHEYYVSLLWRMLTSY